MKTTCIRQNKRKVISSLCVLTLCVASIAILTGCPSRSVSMWTRGPAGNPIKTDDVKLVSTFKDIGLSYKVEGLLCASVLPGIKNNAERQEVLVKEVAAEQGVNSIIGFQPKIGELFRDSSNGAIAIGILAKSGITAKENNAPPPKFIVCLPPVKFKIDKTQSMDSLDAVLRDAIQFYFSSIKGYYVYRTDLPLADTSDMTLDSFDSLGIPADYLLNCAVEGYDETGNNVTGRVKALKINMILFDLKERKTVWAQASEGFSLKYSLIDFLLTGPAGLLMHKLTTPPDELTVVWRAIESVIDTVPPAIPDFKGREIRVLTSGSEK